MDTMNASKATPSLFNPEPDFLLFTVINVRLKRF